MKTESEISHRHKIWTVLLVLIAIAITFAFFPDTLAASWVNSHTSISLKHAAALVSQIGDWPAHVAAGLIGAIVAWFGRR